MWINSCPVVDASSIVFCMYITYTFSVLCSHCRPSTCSAVKNNFSFFFGLCKSIFFLKCLLRKSKSFFQIMQRNILCSRNHSIRKFFLLPHINEYIICFAINKSFQFLSRNDLHSIQRMLVVFKICAYQGRCIIAFATARSSPSRISFSNPLYKCIFSFSESSRVRISSGERYVKEGIKSKENSFPKTFLKAYSVFGR